MRLFAGVAVAVLAGAAAVAVWLRRRFVLVTIQGSSMQPTFHTGDRVLVRRTPLAEIRQGAIVVVESPISGLESSENERPSSNNSLDRKWMIKRAVAVPGTLVPEELTEVLGTIPGDRVPPGHVAVLGDNRNGSYDSRMCGYIPGAQVLGVAVRSVSRAKELRSPVAPTSVHGEPEAVGE